MIRLITVEDLEIWNASDAEVKKMAKDKSRAPEGRYQADYTTNEHSFAKMREQEERGKSDTKPRPEL